MIGELFWLVMEHIVIFRERICGESKVAFVQLVEIMRKRSDE